MLELALRHDKNLMTVRAISEKQDISVKYIEQIISLLTKAGLVISRRGAAGGYRLAQPPDQITVGQILRVTEGNLQIVECTTQDPQPCDRRQECVTSDVWRQIKEAVENVVDHITLADLLEQYRQKSEASLQEGADT